MIGASIKAAEFLGEAVHVLLTGGPARGCGVDAGFLGDGGGALLLLHLLLPANLLMDHLAPERGKLPSYWCDTL